MQITAISIFLHDYIWILLKVQCYISLGLWQTTVFVACSKYERQRQTRRFWYWSFIYLIYIFSRSYIVLTLPPITHLGHLTDKAKQRIRNPIDLSFLLCCNQRNVYNLTFLLATTRKQNMWLWNQPVKLPTLNLIWKISQNGSKLCACKVSRKIT
jgi:hypothetical protein